MSTFAGAFTSSFPRMIPEQTSSAYFSFFSISGPLPRPMMSIDCRAGFFDSDLNLVSSNVPNIAPVSYPKFQEAITLSSDKAKHSNSINLEGYIPVAIAEAVLAFNSAAIPSEEARVIATLLACADFAAAATDSPRLR